MDKVIFHSDLNNFFASVECKDNPYLKEVPMAVVGDKELRHGIILAKNELAKANGVKTAETIFSARQKCKNLVLVKSNINKYIDASKAVHKIYCDYTDLIEPFGIDEVWLDVTNSIKLFGSATFIAEEIRRRIKEELQLTVSIGVSFNKVFAKIGSDLKKPDAITYITRENYKDVVWNLNVSELLFVGKATREKLYLYNIKTIGDLALTDKKFLIDKFKKAGETLYNFANGLDNSPVTNYYSPKTIKSIGNGNTSAKDLVSFDEVKALIYYLSESVAKRLKKNNKICNGIQLSVKNNLLESVSFQKIVDGIDNSESIASNALELFKKNYNFKLPVRAITITAINLCDENLTQISLFKDITIEKNKKLDIVVEALRGKYGFSTIKRANIYKDDSVEKLINSNSNDNDE